MRAQNRCKLNSLHEKYLLIAIKAAAVRAAGNMYLLTRTQANLTNMPVCQIWQINMINMFYRRFYAKIIYNMHAETAYQFYSTNSSEDYNYEKPPRALIFSSLCDTKH